MKKLESLTLASAKAYITKLSKLSGWHLYSIIDAVRVQYPSLNVDELTSFIERKILARYEH